jgi:signal transduction histidine kinase
MNFSGNISLAEYVNAPDFAPLPDVFATIFPFYIVLNRDLNIVHVGPVLQRLYPNIVDNSRFSNHFKINRPFIEMTFDRIRDLPRSLFILESLENGLLLKGQIIYVEYEAVVVFLGSPWITDIEELNKFGLKLPDFALHDTVGDFLFLLQTQKASIADTRRMADKLAKQKVEIKKALVQEKELNSLKTRFITTASHEFRTPLGIIASSTGILEDYDLKFDRPKKLKHWQRIQSAVKHMTTLLEDVLLIYQADAGRIECKRSSLDLISFCHDLIEEIEISSKAEGRFKFTANCPAPNLCVDDDIGIVNVDRKLLRQILTNLLSNAIKYSFPDTEVKFDLTLDSEQLVFQIKDSGIGISAEDTDRLFESFHRGNNVDNIQGTGLGLSIVKRCVEAHGGKIDLFSKVNVGTTFIVSLPLN